MSSGETTESSGFDPRLCPRISEVEAPASPARKGEREMKIRKTIPSLTRRSLYKLAGGVYSAEKLNPPSGEDCTHLLVRADGSLGWCDEFGDQSEDEFGNVSQFSVAHLLLDS
jgi:hypothetical protein